MASLQLFPLHPTRKFGQVEDVIVTKGIKLFAYLELQSRIRNAFIIPPLRELFNLHAAREFYQDWNVFFLFRNHGD